MALKVLYHGTDVESAKKICDIGIIVDCGSESVDFGPGFYTTDDYARAEKWAWRKADLRRNKPAIVKMYFDEAAAESIIVRFQDDLRWGQFIINNRNGYDYFNKFEFPEHNLDQKYPITIGRIADRKATDVADELLRLGKMLNSLDRILNSTYPQQIVFHTQYAVGYIKKIVYSPVQGGR